jgi:acetyl esterase/lipase
MTTSKQTYEIEVADVEYLRHGDRPLLARLFKPRGSGPFPLMVELHGGAWVRGNRLNGNAANEALAKNGVIVAALDFRVPPEASYPASLADIHYGIRWCKIQAAAWTAARTASVPWALLVAHTRPCYSACARTIHATLHCHSRQALRRWTALWAA